MNNGSAGHEEEGGAWSGPAGAEAFAAVEAATDWLLGYPFVFEALSRRIGADDLLVDYGCGPGRVADRAARVLGARVVGVDTSAEMLALARSTAPAVAEFHLVRDGRVTGLPDGCADAVMCNHVLASLPTEEALLGVFAEVRRLLRPGAPFVVLSTDPACTEREYVSLRVGAPGASYRPGEEMPLRLLRTDGSWQEVRNHAWPVDRLPALLESARFRDVGQRRPTVEEARALAAPGLVERYPWTAERAAPPLVITSAFAA
ncbi:class I SAM-dependent methyltransferase [Streptomyces vinaceus]|uniref:Class I SAM-dependent methyltransferase n=1 Tax=Streptomyces vinaceus TaxID=1960 RepID=A0A5J6J1K7_STRVI|nr:class I SAM-dependent methyltransferase [Streptomyces vinaceus]QEV44003.1 class I SAM-dependent methyltransferase [Streptomyces vinaceus]GHE75111.1 methyltransferase UbiE [Streptomyces vinaceus]